MKKVFVDTSYLIAINCPDDQWHQKAVQARQQLGNNVRLQANAMVFHEFLDSASGWGMQTRQQFVDFTKHNMKTSEIQIIQPDHEVFVAGLELYEQRGDKKFSLTDCVSMVMMREKKVRKILSSDHHFEQERFIILMK